MTNKPKDKILEWLLFLPALVVGCAFMGIAIGGQFIMPPMFLVEVAMRGFVAIVGVVIIGIFLPCRK